MAEHPGILPAPETERTYDEQVAALRNMERLLPRFTDIVRASAGDPALQVVVAAGAPTAATDGATVLLPLDIRMAQVDPNDPCTCDDDPEECIYHFTVGLLLHEGAHVSEGSTKVPDEEFFKDFYSRMMTLARESGAEPLKRVGGVVVGVGDYQSALEVVAQFNPMAPGLANAFEDARINMAAGERRSALPQQMRRIVDRFILNYASGQSGFSEAPAAHQIGAVVEVGIEHGLDLKPMMHSDTARNCLNDPVVQAIAGAEMTCTAHACAAAVVLAEYARTKYGLFEPSKDERSGTGGTLKTGADSGSDGRLRGAQQNREVEEVLREEKRLTDKAARTSTADLIGREEYLRQTEGRVPESSRTTRERQELVDDLAHKAAETLRHNDEAVDDLDEVMNQPMTGGHAVIGPEANYKAVILRPNHRIRLGYSNEGTIGEGLTYLAGGPEVRNRYNLLEATTYEHLVESKRRLADALGMNRRSASVPNLVRGRLHGSKLARVPTGNRRAFRRVEKPRKRSYAVLIGVDLSGSTCSGRDKELRRMAYAQASLLDSIGVPFAVVGHTGSRYNCARRELDQYEFTSKAAAAEVAKYYGNHPGLATHKVAKNFAEPWDESAKLATAAFAGCSANLDGITMQTYINMLCTQRATDRILLYYTDGAMPAEDHHQQLVLLKDQLRRAKAMAKLPDRRLHVVGVALDNDEPKRYGLDTILVRSKEPDKSVRLVVDGLAERITNTLK